MASLFINLSCNQLIISSLISRFQLLSQSIRQVLYALLTRPPWLHQCKHSLHHRLACVKHSVSVHPEPGSNSSFNFYLHLFVFYSLTRKLHIIFPFTSFLVCFSSYYSVIYCPRLLFQQTKCILTYLIIFVNYFF